MDTALVISVLALLVAAGAALFSFQQARVQGEQTRILRRQEEERNSAKLEVDAGECEVNGQTFSCLVVTNRGAHPAQPWSLQWKALDGRELATMAGVNRPKRIEPAESVNAPYHRSVFTSRHFEVSLQWTDGRGSEQQTVTEVLQPLRPGEVP